MKKQPEGAGQALERAGRAGTLNKVTHALAWSELLPQSTQGASTHYYIEALIPLLLTSLLTKTPLHTPYPPIITHTTTLTCEARHRRASHTLTTSPSLSHAFREGRRRHTLPQPPNLTARARRDRGRMSMAACLRDDHQAQT